MNKKFNIKKTDGAGTVYLAHTGHSHHWTRNKAEAMEYTKQSVADDLAKLHGGEVVPVTP